MLQREDIKIIENETRKLFGVLGAEVTVQAKNEEETVVVHVIAQDPQEFIGEGGSILADIQHVLRSILRKKILESFYLSLDINEYKKNRENYIREIARTIADEVSLLKREKELPPMSPAERRIVHMEISQREDVVSESSGEEPDRKVVIRPKTN